MTHLIEYSYQILQRIIMLQSIGMISDSLTFNKQSPIIKFYNEG